MRLSALCGGRRGASSGFRFADFGYGMRDDARARADAVAYLHRADRRARRELRRLVYRAAAHERLEAVGLGGDLEIALEEETDARRDRDRPRPGVDDVGGPEQRVKARLAEVVR